MRSPPSTNAVAPMSNEKSNADLNYEAGSVALTQMIVGYAKVRVGQEPGTIHPMAVPSQVAEFLAGLDVDQASIIITTALAHIHDLQRIALRSGILDLMEEGGDATH